MIKKTETEKVITVGLHNDFYRDRYRKVVIATLVALLAVILLVGMILYLVVERPEPKYFSAANDSRITPIAPLSDPIPEPEVMQWICNTIESTNTFDFVTYKDTLQKSQSNFTATGWQSFIATLQQYRILENVVGRKLVITAIPTGTPKLLEKQVVDGHFSWKVSLPVSLEYNSVNEGFSRQFEVIATITRVDKSVNTKGIAIVSYAATLTKQ